MRYLLAVSVLLLLVAAGAYVVAGRQGGPSIDIGKPEKFVGMSTPLELTIGAPGGQLSSLQVVLEQNGREVRLYQLRPGRAPAGRASPISRRAPRASSSPPRVPCSTACERSRRPRRRMCRCGWSDRACRRSRRTTTSITADPGGVSFPWAPPPSR